METSEPAWHARSIYHFILPCSNVERSIAFYARFGFEIYKDNRDVLWPDRVGVMFNMMPGAQGRAVQLVLRHGDELQTRIDLIEWIKPRWVDPYAGKPRDERFPRVMALLTSNVRAAAAELIGQGLVPTVPLSEPNPITGSLGVIGFSDPDGHIVELTEFEPGQLGSKTEGLPRRT